MLAEVIALSLGIVWFVRYHVDCPVDAGKKIMFGELRSEYSSAVGLCGWRRLLRSDSEWEHSKYSRCVSQKLFVFTGH